MDAQRQITKEQVIMRSFLQLARCNANLVHISDGQFVSYRMKDISPLIANSAILRHYA